MPVQSADAHADTGKTGSCHILPGRLAGIPPTASALLRAGASIPVRNAATVDLTPSSGHPPYLYGHYGKASVKHDRPAMKVLPNLGRCPPKTECI